MSIDSIGDPISVNKICRSDTDMDSVFACVHNETIKKIILCFKIKIKNQFYVKERTVDFCPICGETYQPERLNEKTRKGCESLNS